MDTITDNRMMILNLIQEQVRSTVYNEDLPIESTRINQQYKISFMMKTKNKMVLI